MSQSKGSLDVRSRNEAFVDRTVTRIWEEVPTAENPYIAESFRCHGYDQLALMQKRSFVDVFYLLFRGELPTKVEAQLLEQLMIALINPGPRDPATRAAMNAGVGKTVSAHILPIGLTILSGSHNGSGEIEPSMRFLRKHKKKKPSVCVTELVESENKPEEGDWHIAPGFGSSFGGIDIVTGKLADALSSLPGSGETLQWASEFSQQLHEYDMGWLPTGLAAAALTDLGFQPRAASGLFQLLSSPGILAHGLELSNKPRTAMPYVSDDNYIIEDHES
jgi:citrate synthase